MDDRLKEKLTEELKKIGANFETYELEFGKGYFLVNVNSGSKGKFFEDEVMQVSNSVLDKFIGIENRKLLSTYIFIN